MANSNCPICDGAGRRKFSVHTPYLDNSQIYDVMRCGACDHIWCVGDISDALLQRIYSGSFHQTSQQLAGDGEDVPSPVVANAKARAAWLRDLGLVGRLLDVGAGNGYFVREANHAGFDAEGMDLSEKAVATARTLSVKVARGDFMSDDLPASTFDVVTMWDVLCGFPDPQAAMRRAAMLLRPGGKLVFTVADGSSWIARWSGRYWPLLIPPVNLHYFSRESIQRLLTAHGMEMCQFEPRGKQLSVRFVWQKVLRMLRLAPLETKIAAHIPLGWQIRLNLGDIATVVADRKVG